MEVELIEMMLDGGGPVSPTESCLVSDTPLRKRGSMSLALHRMSELGLVRELERTVRHGRKGGRPAKAFTLTRKGVRVYRAWQRYLKAWAHP